MSSNETNDNNVNGSQLAEQGPLSSRCSRQANIGRHHAIPVISKWRKWTNQESKIIMESYLLSDPKIWDTRYLLLQIDWEWRLIR